MVRGLIVAVLLFGLPVGNTLANSASDETLDERFELVEDNLFATGISVICDMHTPIESEEKKGWYQGQGDRNPSKLVFKARSVDGMGVTEGSIAVRRNGKILSVLSSSASWNLPEGLEWYAVTGKYYALITLQNMRGFLYTVSSQGALDDTPASFLNACQIIDKPNLPIISN